MHIDLLVNVGTSGTHARRRAAYRPADADCTTRPFAADLRHAGPIVRSWSHRPGPSDRLTGAIVTDVLDAVEALAARDFGRWAGFALAGSITAVIATALSVTVWPAAGAIAGVGLATAGAGLSLMARTLVRRSAGGWLHLISGVGRSSAALVVTGGLLIAFTDGWPLQASLAATAGNALVGFGLAGHGAWLLLAGARLMGERRRAR